MTHELRAQLYNLRQNDNKPTGQFLDKFDAEYVSLSTATSVNSLINNRLDASLLPTPQNTEFFLKSSRSADIQYVQRIVYRL